MELDLSEAIEAAAHGYLGAHAWGLRSVDDKILAWAKGLIRAQVEAAAPIIERQVRENIARQIEALDDFGYAMYRSAYGDAATLARGLAAHEHRGAADQTGQGQPSTGSSTSE